MERKLCITLRPGNTFRRHDEKFEVLSHNTLNQTLEARGEDGRIVRLRYAAGQEVLVLCDSHYKL